MKKKLMIVFMLLLLVMALVQTSTAVGPSTRNVIEINGIPASCDRGCVGMSACASWYLFCVYIAMSGSMLFPVGAV